MPVSLEDMSDALSVAQAAQLLRRDQKTIRRWIAAGELEAVRVGTGKGKWQITRRALTAYVNRQRSQAS